MELRSVLLLRVSSAVDKVDHPQFFDPPYQLKYMQAGLHARAPELVIHMQDCWVQPRDVAQLLTDIARLRPDLLVVSASSFDLDVANTLVRTLKTQAQAPVVLGVGQGHYLHQDTTVPYDMGYDAILLGEPEQEFFRLVDWLRHSDPTDASWQAYYRACYADGRRFTVDDPDCLPFPSYTAAELQAYKSIFPVRLNQPAVWGFLTATRGCPYSCTFCSEVMRVSTGTKLRSRSAANVADEMAHLAQHGVNVCSFQDDDFTANRHFVRALCAELLARHSTMRWMARGRVDEVDYELLALMRQAGCVLLGFGVEAGSQRIIDAMHKTFRPKPWAQLCRQTFRWAQELGIGTHAYYVIGNPTETHAEIEQTITLALELNADTIQVHFHTPYPGSIAWEQSKEQLGAYDLTQMFHYATPMFSMAQVPVTELVQLRAQFYRRYLRRPRFAVQHLWRYAGFYWHNTDVFWNLLGVRKIL
jgi:radical SAM superfamily enzyme YgiQ (UPF0313 family)